MLEMTQGRRRLVSAVLKLHFFCCFRTAVPKGCQISLTKKRDIKILRETKPNHSKILVFWKHLLKFLVAKQFKVTAVQIRFSLNLERDCISDRVWLDTRVTWLIFSLQAIIIIKKYSLVCIDNAHFMERPKYGTSRVPSGLHTGRGTCRPTSKYGTSLKIRDVWQR